MSDSKWGNGFKQTVFLLANIIFHFEPIQSFLGGRQAVHFLWAKTKIVNFLLHRQKGKQAT